MTDYCLDHIHIEEDKKSQRDKHIRYNKDKKYTKFYHSRIERRYFKNLQ